MRCPFFGGEKVNKIVSRRTINPKYFDEIYKFYVECMVPETRKEPGNISYEMYIDRNDPYTIVMIEEWESEENQDYHEKTSHYRKLKELLLINTQRSADIRFLKRVE